jgi:outer membrane scaffolding protein for murein synthesis (MipA/OmpV family)
METKRRGRPPTKQVTEATAEEPQKADSKEPVEIFVIKQCPNRVWLRGTTRDHVLAYVKVQKESVAASLVGKWVKGVKIDGGEENKYTFFA